MLWFLVAVVCVSASVNRTFTKKGPSPGCGTAPPTRPGHTESITIQYEGDQRVMHVRLPASYDPTVEMDLVMAFGGWGIDGPGLEWYSGLSMVAEEKHFIVVYPDGFNDNGGGDWYSWNCVGTTLSPGPAGPTCNSQAQGQCYTSCAARPQGCDRCDWTTCKDDVGTVRAMVARLKGLYCVNVRRVYATGMSNGGMMTYQLGMSAPDLFAAIAPYAGSIHPGFLTRPPTAIPTLDFHGSRDSVVPANHTVSSDGWFYTMISDIFEVFGAANGCSGPIRHYPTSWDGTQQLYCVLEGDCQADLVRCAFNGAHVWAWQGNQNPYGAKVLYEFLSKHTKM